MPNPPVLPPTGTAGVTQAHIPPGVLDLGVGHPGSDLLPAELLRRAAAHRFGAGDRSFLQYGPEQGGPGLRAQLARFLAGAYGAPVDADDLFITNGVSQGLELICGVFTQPGDTVLVEEPTYFLARTIFDHHGLVTVAVPMDRHGLIPEAVAEALRSHRPRLLYTIPTHQNPSGVTLSGERRARLGELCRAAGTLLVADEVYHLLTYAGTPPPPLALSAGEEHVIALGSFSKILAPGLRLGWLHAAPLQRKRLATYGQLDSGGGLNPFTGAIVESVLELELLEPWVEHLRTVYTRRRDALAQALHTHLGAAAHFALPEGGYFLWLTLDPALGIDTRRAAADAFAAGVNYRAGALFGHGALAHSLRLCFAFYAEADLDEAARRLARALRVR